MADTATSDKVSLVVTGLLTTGAATASVWAQKGPGFTWDRDVTRWISKTIPGLAEMSAVFQWPLVHKWVYASTVLLAVVLLGVLKKRKAAGFLLASVSGSLLFDWALSGLKMPLAPIMHTLFYGTLFGGLALGLHPSIPSQQRGIWWTLAGVVMLASGFATIGTGVSHPVSAWAMSVLVVASWLMILDQLMRA